MNKTRVLLLSTLTLALGRSYADHENQPTGNAAEQDNWYLAEEWSVTNLQGVAYRADPATGKGRVYVCWGYTSSGKLCVYETNGTLVREVSGFYYVKDVVVDGNGTTYVGDRYRVSAFDANGTLLWRTGKNANSGNGSQGSGDGEFYYAHGLALSPAGELYVADYDNHRIQVLDRNGSYKRKFGSYGSAPGQLNRPYDLVFLPDGKLVVADNYYLHFFQADGTFVKRTNSNGAQKQVSVAKDGTLFSNRRLRDADGNSLQYCSFIHSEWSRTCFTPEGDLIESSESLNKVRIWKRAYRSKGLATRNVIPQPAIRGISQRSGTNVIDLDFEIVDPDDANATVGILAAVDGAFDNPAKWIRPSAWVDGTGSKIGSPIATNQVHRVSWNVKGDWAAQTGTLKFEVFCQDARRNAPVDLHFLDLPLPDGNLTISRSPIKDSDFTNHYKYLLATGSSQVSLQNGAVTDANGTTLLTSNLQVTAAGKDAFMNALGHRWAKTAELSLARDASTPGGINAWTASRQVKPRNLPGKVNEYGFDTGAHGHRAWWVVKASTLPAPPEFTVTPFDVNGSGNQKFGRRVAVDGGNVFVAYENTGIKKIHHYEVGETNGSLAYRGVIQAESGNDHVFGLNLAADGERLVVGVSGDWGRGGVYLFERNGSSYDQAARIASPNNALNDYFGQAVDVSGNLIAVGAHGEDVSGGGDAGAAYLFRHEANGSVTELAKLLHEDPKAYDHFGRAIAVGSGVVAVGANKDDVSVSGSNKSDAGSVTLFKVDGSGNVTRTQTLTAPEPIAYAEFGRRVSISGGFLAVSEHRRNTGQSYSGRVYLYKLNANGTAQLTAVINPPNPTYDGNFGFSVDLSGDRLLIGAHREYSVSGSRAGLAYVYKVKTDGSVSLLDVLAHPNGKPDDYFGIAVGVSGKNLVVGAHGIDLPGKSAAGGAVLFRASF